ncbi:MAG: class I SAM-dependent methyltransferase [Anaerolineae bacterium]|nr:class I SAM-dependent methyltransferase [Anaerolineae bacterium]
MPSIMPTLARLYRQARYVAYWAIEPFDALFRRLNRIPHYPPIPLRRHVGLLGGFDGVGFEFVTYLKLLMGMKPSDSLLDLGCGCGMLELALESAGWRGRLVGVDIHAPSIGWAQRTLSKRVPSFQFIHSDIYNQDYWPSGQLTADQWFSQFSSHRFELVIAISLFSLMLPVELELYLREIAQRLEAGGRGLLTFFILNEQQAQLGSRNTIAFLPAAPGSVYSVRRLNAPTAAVAYHEDYLRQVFERHQLRLVDPIRYGTWTGREDGLSYQDIVIVTKV